MTGKTGCRSGRVVCLMAALAVGLGVAVVAGLISMSIYEARCVQDEGCWALLGGLVMGLIAGGIAAAGTVIALAAYAKVGVVFGVGAAIAILFAAGANLGWFQGWAPYFYLLAGVTLAAAFAVPAD